MKLFLYKFQDSGYLGKVMLPEALIKICMTVYRCQKEEAENYLQKNDRFKWIDFNEFKTLKLLQY